MVYYTDSPRMNKRMVAGYYLFLCLVGFAVLLGPTGAGIPISLVGNDGRNPHETAQPNWGTIDPTSCETCHPDEYTNWSTTAHATTVTTFTNATGDFVSIGPHVVTEALFNSSCAECHTTGYNATDHSYALIGVACYDCHNTTSPYLSYSSDVCGRCHTGSGAHPYQYTDWENSAHANSLTDLRSSSHASASCMHCMSTEGFIDQAGTYNVSDTSLNSISCAACHDVHGEWSNVGPGQIRAVNVTELCGTCHSGHHSTYEVWMGGPHELAGLQCTDCHGYDLTNHSDTSTYFLNHTFVVVPELACGQPNNGCHEDNVAWALNQLQTIQSAYNGLVNDMQSEIDSLHAVIVAYNGTTGANHTLVNEVQGVINNVQAVMTAQANDGSMGFHNSVGTAQALNTAYAQLLNEKAYFYESIPAETVTVTNTVTNTVTVTTTVSTPVMDPLFTAGGAVGGIVIGLILGLLVGRRR